MLLTQICTESILGVGSEVRWRYTSLLPHWWATWAVSQNPHHAGPQIPEQPFCYWAAHLPWLQLLFWELQSWDVSLFTPHSYSFFPPVPISCCTTSSTAFFIIWKMLLLPTQRYKAVAFVGRTHRFKPQSWSNTMPCARWAKFDTSGSIKHRLNVINKPIEPRCSPWHKSRSKNPSQRNLHHGRVQSNDADVFCSGFRAHYSKHRLNKEKHSVLNVSTFLPARAMCFHSHMHHPVYS